MHQPRKTEKEIRGSWGLLKRLPTSSVSPLVYNHRRFCNSLWLASNGTHTRARLNDSTFTKVRLWLNWWVIWKPNILGAKGMFGRGSSFTASQLTEIQQGAIHQETQTMGIEEELWTGRLCMDFATSDQTEAKRKGKWGLHRWSSASSREDYQVKIPRGLCVDHIAAW